MKKLIFLLMLGLTIGSATFAQKTEVKNEKTATVPQRVHNVFSKHKHYSGTKGKYVENGLKHKYRHTRRRNMHKVKVAD